VESYATLPLVPEDVAFAGAVLDSRIYFEKLPTSIVAVFGVPSGSSKTGIRVEATTEVASGNCDNFLLEFAIYYSPGK
jgi:hypothetical protein